MRESLEMATNQRRIGHAGDHDRPGWRAGRLALASPGELDPGQFSKLRHTYEQGFRPDLRIPLAQLAAPSPRDRLLVALEGRDPVGFAAIRLLAVPRWSLLRYFGVAADRRRSGYGLRLWHLVAESITDLGWPARIALEAEDPADAAGDPAEQEVRRGRIGFWSRCGARALPVGSYVMPALTDGAHAEPMVLMAVDPGAGSPSLADISGLVRAIFTEHYGLAAADPVVTAALDSIGPRFG